MGRQRGYTVVTSIAFIGVVATAPSLPAQSGDGATRTFTHKGCDASAGECRAAFAFTLRHGERFKLRIVDTDEGAFEYDVAGVVLAASEVKAQGAQLTTKELSQVHDRKYGGYLVHIRRKKDAKSDLPEATLVVSVTTSQWILGAAGGFPVSTLTDRRYALRDTTVGTEKQSIVIRQRPLEDKVTLATATFLHVSHSAAGKGLGLSFGLGLGGTTTYYTGMSKMLGDVGAITLGAAFGPRKEIPAGVRVGDLTTNANLLANPPTRTAVGLFAAFSFTFLGGDKSPFEKPFKGSESAPAAPTPTRDAPAPTTATLSGPQSSRDGDELTFTLTITKPGGGLVNGQVTVSDLTGPVEKGGALTISLTATDNGTKAAGQVKVKAKSLPASTSTFTVGFTVEGLGIKESVTSGPITVVRP